MISATAVPRGPSSLRVSGVRASDATRRVRDGQLCAALEVEGRVELVRAAQRSDGSFLLQAESEAGLERLRFVLPLDADHSPFLDRFAGDPLLGLATRELRGYRPVRLATVAHALLRAVCGQLIDTKRARALEWTIIRTVSPRHAATGLYAAPTARALARLSPVDLRALGLAARKAATLVRLCRTTDLERLHALPTEAAARWIERQRGLGPWSAGVICLEGLGRPERGLTGDLGLIKLFAAVEGRWVEPEETAALLARYGEWAGLASVYLLTAGFRGLVPGVSFDRMRVARIEARRLRSGIAA